MYENEFNEEKEEGQPGEQPYYYSSVDALVDYLRTKEGDAVVNRALGILDDWNTKKRALEQEHTHLDDLHRGRLLWFRGILLAGCLAAVCALVIAGRFDAAPAVFFGAVASALLFARETR